jgi:DNA-binding PadR family transcriptional regulator
MEENLRLTHQTLKVLRVFLEQPSRGLSGSDIWRETKVLSGTLYPILARLELAGWLESWWEDIDPKTAGRPRKRYYKLTAQGYEATYKAFSEIGVPTGALAWNF